MAKRMYANVIMNGNEVNLSIRASSEKEARTKLETLPEYRHSVTEVFDVSPNPPRKHEKEEEEDRIPQRKRTGKAHLFSGAGIFTY